MKKIVALACALLLILGIFSPRPAWASSAALVELTVLANPVALMEDGFVSLSVTVRVGQGNAGQAIQDVSLELQNVADAVGWASISAGSTVSAVASNVYINKSRLGTAQYAILRYKDFDGQQRAVTGSYVVLQGSAVPAMEAHLTFTRTVNAMSAIPGRALTFTYTVSNDGLIDVTDLEITDELTGSIARLDILRPGERKEYIIAHPFTPEMVSSPKLTYTNTSSGQRSTFSLEPMVIHTANPKLSAQLKSDVREIRAGQSVTLNCTIVNEGNIAFYDLQISEEQLGMIPGVETLAPGESYTYSKVLMPSSSASYTLLVSAKDADGTAVSLPSNTVNITVAGTQEAVPTDILSIKAVPSLTRLEAPGEVVFTITVSNTGSSPVSELVLGEMSLGEIERMDSMPSGDKMFYYETQVDATRVFTFTVEGRTQQGLRAQGAAISVEIQVAAPQEETSAPTQTPAPTDEPAPTPAIFAPEGGTGRASALLTALAVVAALIGLCVVLLIVLLTRSRRASRTLPPAQSYASPQDDLPYFEQEAQAPSGAFEEEEDEVTRPVARRKPTASEDARTRPVHRK